MRPPLRRCLKIFRKRFAAMLGLLALLSLAFWLVINNLSPPCTNLEIETAISPDGRLKAVAFARDCGASTDYSTQISLLSSDDKLENEAGNLFIADRDHGRVEAGPGGGPTANIRWLSDREVQISYPRFARTFKTTAELRNIRVSYLPLD